MPEEINYRNFGQVLKQLRAQRTVTQQIICDDLDISITHYSNIENGHARPSLDMIVTLVNYFDITFSDTMLITPCKYIVSQDIKKIFNRCPREKLIDLLEILKVAKEKEF